MAAINKTNICLPVDIEADINSNFERIEIHWLWFYRNLYNRASDINITIDIDSDEIIPSRIRLRINNNVAGDIVNREWWRKPLDAICFPVWIRKLKQNIFNY